MHTVERRGVHLEQCGRCHGIFLDHGELEQLSTAERSYYAPPAGRHPDSPRGYRPPRDSPRAYGGHGSYGHGSHGHDDSPRPYRGRGGYGHGSHGHTDSPRPYGHGGYGHDDSPRPYGHGKRKHKGFLEQLFD